MSAKIKITDISLLHDSSIYVPTRTIYMGSEDCDAEFGESGTDAAMAERVIKNLHILDSAGSSPITILMNNPGGSVYDGLAIYDVIRACESPVTIKVFGQAMSMGAIILQAGDVRLMSPTSRFMAHYGHCAVDRHSKTFINWAAEEKRTNEWMEYLFLEKIRQKNPKFKLKRLKEMLNFDTFLTAQETVDLGLADGVLVLPFKKEIT